MTEKEKLGAKTYSFKEGVWRRKRQEMRNDKGRMTEEMWRKLAVY